MDSHSAYASALQPYWELILIRKTGYMYLKILQLMALGLHQATGDIVRVDLSGKIETTCIRTGLPTAMTFGPDGKFMFLNGELAQVTGVAKFFR